MHTFYTEPPRDIPLRIKLENLFGGFSNQFGWIFFSFGLIFVWVFTMQSDLTSWYHFRGEVIKTRGTITSVNATNMTVNDRKVYEYFYTFEDSNGQERNSSSFSSSHTTSSGIATTIEYPVNKPEKSRIKNMGRSKMGLFGLFPLIFPLIGLVFIFFGFKKGLKANRLLKIGYMTEGELVDKVRTNTRVNNQTVYKMTFKFHARNGSEYFLSSRTHQTYRLEDEPKEKLLYNNKSPNDAVMFDSLNSRLKLQPDGTIKSGSLLNMIGVLFIPLISIVVHGSIIIILFIK